MEEFDKWLEQLIIKNGTTELWVKKQKQQLTMV